MLGGRVATCGARYSASLPQGTGTVSQYQRWSLGPYNHLGEHIEKVTVSLTSHQTSAEV